MAEIKEDPIVDFQEKLSRTELYIEENKKSLAIIIGSILLLVAAYFGWKKLYKEPLEAEAQSKLFMAERYFEKDSLTKAIKGDGLYPGFEEIAEEYGSTKAGNLAHYYLGLCFFQKADYQAAIDNLEKFEAEDVILGPVATAAIGDAYQELGKTEEAVSSYLKAAAMNKNQFTTPIILMKAGKAYEAKADYKEAVKIYEQIKTDYPETNEGRDIEKYIAYAKTKAGIE
jgi:tetratricopeptide (TPR) repeat protein